MAGDNCRAACSSLPEMMAPAAGKAAPGTLSLQQDLALQRGDHSAEEHSSNYNYSPYIIPEVDGILSHKIKHEAFFVCVFSQSTFVSFLCGSYCDCIASAVFFRGAKGLG